MNEEIIMHASILEQQAQELTERLQQLEQEIFDLTKLKVTLENLISSQEKITLSPLSKGVLIKTEIKEKELFVEVGLSILVKKKPKEVLEIVNSQILRLTDANKTIETKLSIATQALQSYFNEIERQQRSI